MGMGRSSRLKQVAVAGALACIFLGGCDQARGYLAGDAAAMPSAEDIAPYYASHAGVLGIEVSGNVVQVRVRQPYDQVDRGGALWARVGPFVYLFTPATRQVFHDFPGVAAVRVVTALPDGDEVARAMLRRDALNDARWRRSLNILGHALQEGQAHPRRLEELTEWGEGFTEYRYNPDYVGR
jgi:hypothetical protein